MKAIVLYLPVIGQHYLSFLDRHSPAHIFLLSAESVKAIDSKIGDQLKRDIRALPVESVKNFLSQRYKSVSEGTKIGLFGSVKDLKRYHDIVMPDEDISHVIQKLLPWAKVEFDNAFLRWDWSNSTVPSSVEGVFPISNTDEDRFIMAAARTRSGNSSDVWRQVGAAVKFADNTILTAFNQHMPDMYDLYVNGDPRLHMSPGERPEICTAIHAENNLIAIAAKQGRALDGLSIYVTTFPCAPCARAIEAAGFKKVFFQTGYSNLDAAEVLTKAGIEVIQVK